MRRTLLVLGVTFASVAAALAASLSVLLFSDWGHRRICHLVSSGVSSAIAGTLEIDGIDELHLPVVKAHGIRILDPDGVLAIEVESAEIELDLEALLEGRLAWHRASVDRGTVRLTENASGRNNLERTFRARSVEPGAAGTAGDGASAGAGPGFLDLRAISTSHMRLLIGEGSLPTLRIVGIHGVMRIRERESGKVELRFDGFGGSVVDGLPTGRLDFHRVRGFVQSDSNKLLRFEGPAASEGEPVEFVLEILTRPAIRVKIDALFPEVSAESLATLAFSGYSKFTRKLDVTVRHGRK